jgi:type VI secretion system secreted protein VgrG
MSVRSILEAVLADAGLSSGDVRFDLQASYAPREFCVQYRESDLAFLHRLMEFEGIYYFFDHTDGQDTIVVTDHGQVHEPMPAPAALPYDEGGGMVGRRVETVDRFVAREQMVSGGVQLQTYDYRTPETRTARADGPEQMPGARREYGTHARSSDHANRLATVRREALEARRRTMTGESDCLGLRSGFTFSLEEHFRSSLNVDYLVTHVEHRGSQREGLDLDARPPLR